MYKKGFTLIELLVVVAIIGILASVVLASLNSAREKAVDVAIKGALSSARPQAALYYEDHASSYTSMCTSGTVGGIYPMVLNAAEKLAVGIPPRVFNTDAWIYSASGADYSSVCHATAPGWAAITSLKAPVTAGSGWCVDYTGASKESPSLGNGVVVCP